MGYQVKVVQINWEKKKELVESGEIDCIMGCFSMEGRLDDYRWAGPYIASRQVVAVNENSDIYKLRDLEGKNLAVQSTTKPESIFLNRTDERIPKLGNLISLGHRELIYTFLGKGYVDAVAAHEESIVQYMKDYDTSFRILSSSFAKATPIPVIIRGSSRIRKLVSWDVFPWKGALTITDGQDHT